MAVGHFIWHELLSKDVEAAKRFYGQLFGWKTTSFDLGLHGQYTLFLDGDRPAAGMASLTHRWVPSNWTPYVYCDDIERAAKAAVFWGGDITGGPLRIPGAGEVLMISDNQGAAITLLHPDDPKKYPPAKLRVGGFCNHVLNARDIKRAGDFYAKLFGWKLKMVDVGLPKKAMVFVHDKTRVATLNRLAEDAHEPNSWVCGVGVKALPAAHQRAIAVGGTSLAPPRRAGKLGATSVLRDPSGAAFCLYEPAGARR